MSRCNSWFSGTWLRPAVLGALCWLAVACAARGHDPQIAEHMLEERLLAPCCWREPLRDHISDSAAALRAEVRTRLASGEPPASIEADLVERYGERIRALPADGDPRWMIVAAFAALAGAGLFALWRVLHPRAALLSEVPPSADVSGADASVHAAYESRLDDDLAAVD